jgi:hypothetical protein
MNRRSKGAILLVSLVFGSATFLSAAASPDPLWQKALTVARTNSDWVAGLVITRSEVIYKGETNGVHELWQRTSLGKDGGVITETVKVLEDGKDITKQEAKKEKDKKKKGGSHDDPGGGGNPFSAAVQDRLSLTLTNGSCNIEGKECVGYLFALRNTNGPTTRGVAWLEKATGIPAELENVTFDPLPDKHLKAMAVTTRYELTPDGAWRVKEMRTLGKVSMFLVKADIQSTMTFSQYWRRPRRGKEHKD